MSSTNTPSQMFLKLGIGVALCAALVVLPMPAFLPRAVIAQEGVRDRSAQGDLECVSYCSHSRPGTVLMEVALRLADRAMSQPNVRTKLRQQGLEATVYAEGFERGLFATVPAIRARALFRTTPRPGAKPAQKKIPALEKLVITNVITRRDKTSQSLLLRHPPPGVSGDDGEWVTVLLEGFDSGIAYSYRSPGGSSVVRCQAASCPVDRIPAPANRTNRRP